MSVRSGLSPLGAAIGAALRRRSLLLLLVVSFGVFGLISWGSFSSLKSERDLVAQAESGELQGFEIFNLVGGTTCFEDGRCEIVDREGNPLGIAFTLPEGGFSPTDEPPELKAIQENMGQLTSAVRRELEEREQELSWRATLRDRLRAAGTLWGVILAVIAGATLLGAEWRWGVWRTLLTHEPRRGRVLLSRLGMLWVVVGLGFVAVIAFASGMDALFRAFVDVDASGGPGPKTLGRDAAKALLSVEVYATIAGVLATTVRASFAGIGSLVLLLGEGLLVRRFESIRHFSPAQQVARLFDVQLLQGGVVWWEPLRTGPTSCTLGPDGGLVECRERILPPIPQWRAVVVLLAWIVVAGLIGAYFLRRRDVPQ